MKPEEFFDIAFYSLPSYIHQKEEFLSGVMSMKSNTIDDKHPDYFFKNCNKNVAVPFDSFYHYGHKLWKKILDCEDINIPSERDLISIERCTQIKSSIFQLRILDLKNIEEKISKQIYGDLAKESEVIIKTSLNEFENRAYFYNQEIAQKMKLELKEKLNDNLIILLKRQIDKIKKYMKQKIEENFKDVNINIMRIYEHSMNIKNNTENEILNMLEKSKSGEVEYVLDNDKEYIKNKLKEKFDNHIEKLYNDFSKNFITYKIETPTLEKLKLLRDDMKQNFWDELSRLYEGILVKCKKDYSENLKIKFNMNENEIKESWLALKEKAQKFIQKQLQEFALNYLEIYISKV